MVVEVRPAETILRVEFSPDPLSVVFPTYYDITRYLEDAEWWSGKQRELEGIQAGGCHLVLDNDRRRFEPGYLGTEFTLTADADNVTDTERAAGTTGDNRAFHDLEFWSHFLAGADGTAPAWTVTGSILQGKSGSEARQFTYVTDPVTGSRVLKVEVADGDKFGSTTGERGEVYRNNVVGSGYGVFDVAGTQPVYGLSVKPESDFVLDSGWNIFHQLHADDSLFGQAPFRLQVDNSDPANPMWRMSLDTGQFADAAAALANSNPGTDVDVIMLPFEIDQWFDLRYQVNWTTDTTGWVILQMRKRGGAWHTYTLTDIQTVPRYTGQAASTKIYDKLGYYRSDAGTATVHVSYDNYWVGHAFSDDPNEDVPQGGDSSVGIYPAVTNLSENTDAKTNTTGTQSAGGGTTTVSRVTTRGIRGTAFKADCNGGASGQGIFHRELDGDRYQSVDAGETWTAVCWFEGDIADPLRVGIEWSNSGGSVISTTFALAKPLTSDPRMHYLTAVAPANAVTARVRTSWSGTTAGIFYVSGMSFTQTKFIPPLIPVDNTAGGVTRGAGREQMPATLLDETAFWFAIRMRLEHDRSSGVGFYPLLWGDDGNNLVALQYDSAGTQWVVKRLSGGGGAPLNLSAKQWRRGDYVTMIVCGTASQLKVSEDGDAFTTASHSTIPTLSASLFDIGSGGTISANQEMAGAIKWAAFGTGYELTDADALELAGFTDNDPWAADLADMGVTGVWTADDATSAGGSPIDLWTRFRLTLEDPDGSERQGVYYLTDPGLSYRRGSPSSLVEFDCVDAIGLLGELKLPRRMNPESTSWEDDVAMLNPTLFMRLGEDEGTKSVQHVKKKRKRRKGESKRHYRKHAFRRWKTRETRAEAEGSPGPSGTYKNTPTLGEPSLVVGDAEDTSVKFVRANSEYVRVNLEDGDVLTKTNRISVLALIKPDTLTAAHTIVGGRTAGAGGVSPFLLYVDSSGNLTWIITNAAGVDTTVFETGAIAADTRYVVAATWDGTTARLYIDGPEVNNTASARTMAVGDDNSYLMIANNPRVLTDLFDGHIDEVAIWERTLDATTIAGLYQMATTMGRPEEAGGARIAALIERVTDLFALTDVDTNAGFFVQPIFYYGQSPLDEIEEVATAEMPHALFFADGDGQLVYLPFDYKDAVLGYDTVAAEVSDDPADADTMCRYDDADVSWDPEFYNVVPTSIDGGDEQLNIDQPSIDKRLEHVFEGGLGLLLANDGDADSVGFAIAERFSGGPTIRPKSVTLFSADDNSREHIMSRQPGDLIRFKRRGELGDAMDVNCRLLGWRKTYAKTQCTCTWYLARAE